MASPEPDTIKGLLQSLEHSVDATYRVTGLCRHLLNAQRDGTAIVPSAVQRYEEQLTELTRDYCGARRAADAIVRHLAGRAEVGNP